MKLHNVLPDSTIEAVLILRLTTKNRCKKEHIRTFEHNQQFGLKFDLCPRTYVFGNTSGLASPVTTTLPGHFPHRLVRLPIEARFLFSTMPFTGIVEEMGSVLEVQTKAGVCVCQCG